MLWRYTLNKKTHDQKLGTEALGREFDLFIKDASHARKHVVQ